MGSSQSSRKLTIANEEDDANVIRISDAVAQRLAQSAAAETPESPRPIAQAPPPRPASAVPQEAVGQGANFPNYTMSALAMQQKKDQELADQETYWQRRLQNLEKSHEKINRVIDDEYKKALAIFDDCKVIKAQDAVKPCKENSQKVLKCYQENPRETLQCADLVQQFTNCVDQRRANIMKC